MKKKAKIVFAFFFAAVLAWALVFCFIPVLIIETEYGIYKWMFVNKGTQFSLKFIHSVELTPVIENFVITGSKTIKLQSIEYQSFGAGLPFSQEDGVFYQDGDKFIIKGMNREFKTIEFLIYPDNKLTFIFNDKQDYLYEKLSNSSFVRFKIKALSVYFIKKYLTIT